MENILITAVSNFMLFHDSAKKHPFPYHFWKDLSYDSSLSVAPHASRT